MPRVTHPAWVAAVHHLLANEPELSSVEIAARLESLVDVAEPELGPPPNERTVRRIRDRFSKVDAETRATYRLLAWPGSFDSGLLPRESTRALLDEVAFWHRFGGRRISLRWARWYWQLCQAAGESRPTDEALRGELRSAASALAAMEVLGGPSSEALYALEMWLAFRPWESHDDGRDAGREAYEAVVKLDELPRWQHGFEIPPDTPPHLVRQAYVEFYLGDEQAVESVEAAMRRTGFWQPRGSEQEQT